MKCLRVRYTKLGKVRFVGHRDVARIWERALRKAEIPVLYSQGFSPHPRISFGLALPTGFESEAEYLDIYLDEDFFLKDFNPISINENLSNSLPNGMDVLALGEVETSEDSLQEAVDSCVWQVQIAGVSIEDFEVSREKLISSEIFEIERQRKGKIFIENVRPQVHSITVTGKTAEDFNILTELGTKPRVLRPTDLLRAINPELRTKNVLRKEQIILQEDERFEPLSIRLLPATPVEVLA
ncbi:MAG: TIGR03936 family radical SAM-associated protein [Actinomycetota bacterium]|nr:TIGR03936 family radical SAM-associated protein [Actinomycetota bacterium]